MIIILLESVMLLVKSNIVCLKQLLHFCHGESLRVEHIRATVLLNGGA